MLKKKVSLGLILLLLCLALGGCRAGGLEKEVVFSQEAKPAGGIENTGHFAASIQQAEAVEKAEAAFRQYFDIQNIGQKLVLKAALIEDDGILWMNPYWKLSWLAQDAKKPIYSAEIDAQTGEVVQLRYRSNWDYKTISREDVLACRDTALAFIDEFALVKDAPLSLFEAFSSTMEGVCVEFRYGPDRFITFYFNQAGAVEGFRFSQQVSYTLAGSDLKVDRTEAIELARASVKQYCGEVNTGDLIEQVQLVEGDKGEKTWFIYWKNIAVLEGRYISYGAQIDALSGKICAVSIIDHSLSNTAAKLNEAEQREIADRFVEQKNLSDYRFEAFDEELGSLRYRDQAGAPLHIFVDQGEGKVEFLSFIELK